MHQKMLILTLTTDPLGELERSTDDLTVMGDPLPRAAGTACGLGKGKI